jgi:hypothetical protein
LSVPFQIYSRSVCRNQQVAKRLSAPEAFVAPREQAIRRIGVVTVTAAVCGCGRRVEPADFEAVNGTLIRAVCPGCHRDLLQITRTWREQPDAD